MYKKIIKPVFDFVAAFFAIIILAPIFFAVAIAIRLDSKGPVFFKQNRLGLKGKVFSIYKFRSMITDQREGRISKEVYENDPRITRVGSFLRKTSIDELPQLINIIRGEMSFIGPRPPLPHFPKIYELYNETERKRFMVKPGISGLAQIRCREIHDWDINIPIDVEYVENFSMKNDLSLFIKSLGAFFNTKNVYRTK